MVKRARRKRGIEREEKRKENLTRKIERKRDFEGMIDYNRMEVLRKEVLELRNSMVVTMVDLFSLLRRVKSHV